MPPDCHPERVPRSSPPDTLLSDPGRRAALCGVHAQVLLEPMLMAVRVQIISICVTFLGWLNWPLLLCYPGKLNIEGLVRGELVGLVLGQEALHLHVLRRLVLCGLRDLAVRLLTGGHWLSL